MDSTNQSNRSHGYSLTKVGEVPYNLEERAAPHRYFKCSYEYEYKNTIHSSAECIPGNEKEAEIEIKQVVHKHVNGLCVVTAGDCIRNYGDIDKVEFLIGSDSLLVSSKKRKVKRGHPSHVRANTPLVKVYLKPNIENGVSDITLFSCVTGNIIELNTERLHANPGLLSCDPLLNGYLAIIQESPGKKTHSFQTNKNMHSHFPK